jgi:hypothetical protein
MHTKFWLEIVKGRRDHSEDEGVDGKKILNGT